VAEVAAAYKECDDAGEAVSGETDDEEHIAEAAPHCDDHKTSTSAGAAGTEEE
jgi:hypothetical protein